MIRIYHNERAAIVANDTNKIFWWLGINSARELARQTRCVVHYELHLEYREAYLLDQNYVKSRWDGE